MSHRLCSSFASSSLIPKGSIHLIESSGLLGLTGRKVPNIVRVDLQEKLLRAGMKHLHLGILDCPYNRTPTISTLQTIKDIEYGNKTLSTGIVLPHSIYKFMNTGADELLLPISLQYPFINETFQLFCESIRIVRKQGYLVRLMIIDPFSSTDKEVHKICIQALEQGCNSISLIDMDHSASISRLGTLSSLLRSDIPLDLISLGFRSTNLSTIYSALDEGYNQFHTSISGLGGYSDTQRVIQFLQLHGYSPHGIHVDSLQQIHKWLQEHI